MFPLALLNQSSPAVDPTLTLALLHFEGADGSTVFTDSVSNYTIQNNSAQVSSFELKNLFTSSGFFNNSGTSPFRSIQTVENFADLRSKDFTAECLIYQTARHFSESGLFNCSTITTTRTLFGAYIDTSGVIKSNVFDSVIAHQTVLNLNQTYHIALVRKNNSFNLYVDGVKSTQTVTVLQSYIDSNYSNVGQLHLGCISTGSASHFTGYIDEFRASEGAVYTSNFTPPTSAFTY